MSIKELDLQFVGKVSGGKEHWVFKQDSFYLIMTEMNSGTRGNVEIFDSDEIEQVKKDLSTPGIPNRFHCDDVHPKVNGLKVYTSEISQEKIDNYRSSRLRNICYVLVTNGFLKIEKDGNSIYFIRRSVGSIASLSENTVPVTTTPSWLKPPPIILKKRSATSLSTSIKNIIPPKNNPCPYCGCHVNEKNMAKHKENKCPMRPIKK